MPVIKHTGNYKDREQEINLALLQNVNGVNFPKHTFNYKEHIPKINNHPSVNKEIDLIKETPEPFPNMEQKATYLTLCI